MVAKVENGVTQSCQKNSGKTGKTQFWHDFFHFFEQDRLLFARVDSRHRRDRISDKNSRKRRRKKMGLIFFFQKCACASRFQWGNFTFFWPRKN